MEIFCKIINVFKNKWILLFDKDDSKENLTDAKILTGFFSFLLLLSELFLTPDYYFFL